MLKWLKDLFLDKEPHPEKYEQLRQQPKPTVQKATTRSMVFFVGIPWVGQEANQCRSRLRSSRSSSE